MKRLLLLVALMPFAQVLAAQTAPALPELNADRLHLNFVHGMMLLVWAVLNLTVGGYLTWLKRGQVEAFWHMNAAFNLVNFCIAAVMLHQTVNTDPGALGHTETLRTVVNTHGLMMLNIGLDVCYALTGLWMKEYGRRRLNKAALLRGFGQALILQGLFLLCLDVTFTTLYFRTAQPLFVN